MFARAKEHGVFQYQTRHLLYIVTEYDHMLGNGYVNIA